ncbi:hypothetical protein RE762_004461 [Salmonella enterica]|nr:hypothetical protein [Salmonella enterica]
MLARISGGNDGIGYYLEHGNKQGREYTRDELDKRLILDGDLALTESVIKSIPDNGQERYIHISLSFYENEISEQTLKDVVQDYKSLLMNAYHEDEYCFYAEAHLPKIKYITDNQTGENIERKSHIHIVIPEINLVTGKHLNPRGRGELYISQIDAIQEHINNKYNLVSPKDGIRVSDHNHANVLSRSKGDLFKERQGELKSKIFDLVDKQNIRNDTEFKQLLSGFGQVKEYNKGEDNRYFGIKLEGDSKFTRLKSPLFSRQYISERKIPLVKPTAAQIKSRLNEWTQKTSYEIKYIHPAGEKIRKTYASLNGEKQNNYLQEVIKNYEKKYQLQREDGRQGDFKSRTKRDTGKSVSNKTVRLSRLSERRLVYGLHGRSGRAASNKPELLLQAHEHGDLSATGRKKINSDRYVRRLQERTGGRVIQSPIESEIKKALYNTDDLPLLKLIRSEINPERYLSYLHVRFNIDPLQHTVTFTKDGSPRFRSGNRNMNASDFLTKHMNLEWEESKQILLDIWHEQKENKPFPAIHARVNLTRQQAKERFVFFNEHKKWVNDEIKQKHAENIAEYKRSLRELLAIRDKQEREVERGYIIFKKMEKENVINTIRLECFYHINAHFNHWQPERGNNMALGDALKKIIKNPVEDNSITSAAAPEVYSVAKRIQTQQRVDEYVKRELTDLVPHKVSPKEVRYLDPKSTQTVFVDKGDHIRISGEVTQDKTEAMLLYAKEKYGGVLKLNGSEEFKISCVMAAAEKGMSIILKPDQYHEMMQSRIAEIQAEKGINQDNTLNKAEHENDRQPEQAKAENLADRTSAQENTVQKEVQPQQTPQMAESPFEQKIKELEQHYQTTRDQFGTIDGEMITGAEITSLEDGTYNITFVNDDTLKQVAGFHVSDDQLKELTGKSFAEISTGEDMAYINSLSGVHLESAKIQVIQQQERKEEQPQQASVAEASQSDIKSEEIDVQVNSPFEQKIKELEQNYQTGRDQFSTIDGEMITGAEISSFEDGTYNITFVDEEASRQVAGFHVSDAQLKEITGKNFAEMIADEYDVVHINAVPGVHLESDKIRGQQQVQNPIDELRNEAESLVLQQREAQRLLDEAEKNNFPQEEIGVLAKGVNAITARVQVVTEQLKQAEAELQQKSESLQAEGAKSERTLDGELDNLARKLSEELKVDKALVRESLQFAKFKDVADLDNWMNDPEKAQAVKNDVMTHQRDTVMEKERQQLQNNDRSR